MTLYEDRLVIAELATEAAARGHVIVRLKTKARHLGDLSGEESAHLFTVASYTAAILFQGLQAEGTNIICNEDEEQLTVHVIARRNGDGLGFQWEPMALDEGVMGESMERIKDQAYTAAMKRTPEKEASEQPAPSPEQPKGAPVRAPEKDARMREAEESENQLIKQLLRVP